MSFMTPEEWDEWSNELATMIPEDDVSKYSNPDGAQESIITDCFQAYTEERRVDPSKCLLCGKPILSNDKTVWKQVIGWVGGPKKDSMRLRDDTGRLAHDDCVKKLQAGQAIDQPSMFDDSVDTSPIVVGKTWQEVMGNDNCL